MNAITLECPDSWLMPMATDASHFAKDAKMAAAVKLIEVDHLEHQFTNANGCSSVRRLTSKA